MTRTLPGCRPLPVVNVRSVKRKPGYHSSGGWAKAQQAKADAPQAHLVVAPSSYLVLLVIALRFGDVARLRVLFLFSRNIYRPSAQKGSPKNLHSHDFPTLPESRTCDLCLPVPFKIRGPAHPSASNFRQLLLSVKASPLNVPCSRVADSLLFQSGPLCLGAQVVPRLGHVGLSCFFG